MGNTALVTSRVKMLMQMSMNPGHTSAVLPCLWDDSSVGYLAEILKKSGV
jgi:hypothetical protein